MRYLKPGLALLFILAKSHSALADESSWFYVDLGLGIKRVLSTATVTRSAPNAAPATFLETPKNGYVSMARAVYSYYWSDWAVEAGMGGYFSQMPYSNYDPETASSKKAALKMTRNNFIVTFVPRFRPDNNFSIGPLFRGHFGGNVGHAEDPGVKSAFALSAGVEALFEYPIGDVGMFRWGLQGDLDLLEDKRSVAQVTLILGYGFRMGYTQTTSSERAQRRKRQKWRSESEDLAGSEKKSPDDLPSMRSMGLKRLVLSLPGDSFLFNPGTNLFHSPKITGYLRELGSLLRRSNTEWSAAHITNYAPEATLNTRGAAFLKAIQNGGAPTQKISSESVLIKDHDINSDKSRIEIQMECKDPEKFFRLLKALNRRYDYTVDSDSKVFSN